VNVLVTGAAGFIGRNLVCWLRRWPCAQVLELGQEHSDADLDARLAAADLIYHLAGVNRPPSEQDFERVNVDLTARMCEALRRKRLRTPVVLSSSIQAGLDNPYGVSKRRAEAVLSEYAAASGAAVTTFRLSNVFGKWCRPHYNSVVATFCHNIARDLPITIADPDRAVPLVHVDDVVQEMLGVASSFANPAPPAAPASTAYREVGPVYTVTLGELAALIRSFRESRRTLRVPVAGEFERKLYGTYLSYLPENDFAYDLQKRTDARGSLAEFLKSPSFGQMFVSRTTAGVTRGNHFHHTKAEKFLVLEGEAVIRFRHVTGGKVIEYAVRGEDFRVVDIPTGYTHSIQNVGDRELVTLFWSSEVFDPERPDTISEGV